VVALAAGAVVWAQRRKNAAAQPEEDMRLAQRPEQSIPYEPVRKAPTHVPPVLPAAAHTAAAPPVPHSAPEMSEEANTREAIDNLETILQDAETAGLDTSKARQSLKIARNFFEMGKYQKAMLYCKMAEDNLG
jgi:nucleotide-binding universal stress UspA family protein